MCSSIIAACTGVRSLCQLIRRRMPQDMYAVGNDAPMLDKRQDVELLDGYENATHTVFTFRRPLRSCDTEHDLDLGVSTTLTSG